jgi:AraC family transcriptional regulator
MLAPAATTRPPSIYEEWLLRSGETPGNFPIFFHYVNTGPSVREEEMITDVYVPLK